MKKSPRSGSSLPAPRIGRGASPASPGRGEGTLESEIASLQRAIQWLDGAFSEAASLDERLKITSALAQASAQLGRLLHIQALLHAGRSSEVDEALQQVLEELAQEWAPTSAAPAPATPAEAGAPQSLPAAVERRSSGSPGR